VLFNINFFILVFMIQGNLAQTQYTIPLDLT
jgi:hypothetical protein